MAAAECGIELARHHEAGADARACAEVVLELARRRRSRKTQMPLTACPLSNETLRCVDSLSEHSLRRMLDAGSADT